MGEYMKITVTQEEIDALLDAAHQISQQLEAYQKQLETAQTAVVPAKATAATKASTDFISNTYKYFVDLPHQHKAIAFLAQHLPAEVAIEFERLWRDDPGNQKPVTPAMVVPAVAKVAEEKPKRLVDKIVAYMKMKGYQIYTVNGKVNIVYIEGMNPDGSLNDDTPNWFNDVRIVFEYRGDKPEILGIWEATTEPGYFYTQNPMNPDGCARIQFGQYHAWQVGYHGVADPHEALVQYDNVTLCRDLNQDYSRIGDKLYTGYDFGINQHWGGDSPVDSIGRWSAGCLVGRTRDGHRAFMKIVKQDRDYVKNKNYVFSTTIIPGDDLMKKFPG
jgi:hypothetical protein